MLDVTLCGCDEISCAFTKNIFFCCRSKKKKTNGIYRPACTRGATKTILCRALTETIDINKVFSENNDSLSIVVNNESVVISTSSSEGCSILNVPSNLLINKRIDQLDSILPAELILIIQDIITSTRIQNESTAIVVQICQDDKSPQEYLLASFPIVNKQKQYGVILIHQPLNISVDRKSLLTTI